MSVLLKLWDDTVLGAELMNFADEPKWMKPLNPHPIAEHYSVYIRMSWGSNYLSSPLGQTYVVNVHNSSGHLPKEAEAKFEKTAVLEYFAKFFHPYNVSHPHPIPPEGNWYEQGQGDGRIYVAVKETQSVYWATLD